MRREGREGGGSNQVHMLHFWSALLRSEGGVLSGSFVHSSLHLLFSPLTHLSFLTYIYQSLGFFVRPFFHLFTKLQSIFLKVTCGHLVIQSFSIIQ